MAKIYLKRKSGSKTSLNQCHKCFFLSREISGGFGCSNPSRHHKFKCVEPNSIYIQVSGPDIELGRAREAYHRFANKSFQDWGCCEIDRLVYYTQLLEKEIKRLTGENNVK